MKINSEDGDKNGITEEGFIKTCLMAEKAGIYYIQISNKNSCYYYSKSQKC